MANPKVTRLPTAATSYYTIRKAGKHWAVELVTPSPFRDLRTKLRVFSEPEAAEAEARATAERMQRPFKARGGRI